MAKKSGDKHSSSIMFHYHDARVAVGVYAMYTEHAYIVNTYVIHKP